jgi:hypothetical protein
MGFGFLFFSNADLLEWLVLVANTRQIAATMRAGSVMEAFRMDDYVSGHKAQEAP